MSHKKAQKAHKRKPISFVPFVPFCGYSLMSRRGRRSLLDLLPKLHNPQPGVDVVEVDQSAVRLRAPGERQVRTEAVRIAGIDARDLATLSIKITTQLTRHIDDATAATVIPEVHHIILDPYVMRAAFRHRILRHLARIVDVGNIDHMNDTAHGDALIRSNVEEDRKSTRLNSSHI